MSWEALDAKFPMGHVGDIEAAATHVMRLALGLPVRETSRDGVLFVIRKADNWTLKRFYDEDTWRGMMALVAAYYSDWDLVGEVTGGALGTRVILKKTFGAHTTAFARHVATACARKLPAEQLAVAMAEQHERYVAGICAPDARVAVIAAHLFIRELAIVPDVIAATKQWLDGTFVLEAAAPAAKAVADGEDARVKIFERYAPELEDGPIDQAVAGVYRHSEAWARHLHRDRIAMDDLAIRAFVARRSLWPEWHHMVDPIVGAWLGGEPVSMTKVRFQDVARVGPIALGRGTYWDEPIQSLACGGSIERAKTVAWKPGKFFKDDARKLFAYLATAVKENATEADVTPAWHDFLARRSPATTPMVEEGALHWKSLLALQAVVTQRIGKRAANQVGGELRRAITGSFA
ncbi:MAG: hypothetical protein QM831_08475 [Kofleriaceae bacterium]